MRCTTPGTGLSMLHRATAGTLFGAQVVMAAAVVPMSRTLSLRQYVAFHTALTRHADAVLPLLGEVATLVSYARYRRYGRVADLAATAALVAAGAASMHNFTINARVAAMDPAGLQASSGDSRWLAVARGRWAKMHHLRLTGGMVAFAAALSNGGPRSRLGRPSSPRHATLLDPLAALVATVAARDAVAYLSRPGGQRQPHA
jgi:hypothetical protein